MEPPELDELVRRAKRRDVQAIDALVRAFSPRLYGMLYRMTGSVQTAEDCLQETCLRLVRTIGDYQHDGRFEAWLFRIAANLARDQRRLARHPARGRGQVENLAALDVRSSERRPAESLARRDAETRLREVLDGLPELDREIVLLRYFAELSFREISEMLKVPLGTALARAHRALGKLRAELKDQDL